MAGPTNPWTTSATLSPQWSYLTMTQRHMRATSTKHKSFLRDTVSAHILETVPQTFRIALRGYDRAQVDRLIDLAQSALASGSDSRRAAARQALRGVYLRTRVRGYARRPVDRAIHEL